MDQPLVYVIVVNYNGWRDTICCLQSLLNMDYSEFKIIVVDNGSQDDSIKNILLWAKGTLKAPVDEEDPLKDLYLMPTISCEVRLISDKQPNELEKINLIPLYKNYGFSYGNNRGIKIALSDSRCKYIWLLNNDTVVKRDSLSKLVEFAERGEKKKIGIIGSRLLYYDSPMIINGIGGRYLKWIGKPIQLAINCVDNGQEYDKLDYVIGASMLVKTDFVRDVGLMSEEYFLYYEELDWAIRARQRGWFIGQCNQSIVYHKEGSTIGSNKRRKTKTLTTDYYTQRNKVLITKKYYPYCLPTVLLVSLILCFFKTIRFGFTRLRLLSVAIYHGLKGKAGCYEGL